MGVAKRKNWKPSIRMSGLRRNPSSKFCYFLGVLWWAWCHYRNFDVVSRLYHKNRLSHSYFVTSEPIFYSFPGKLSVATKWQEWNTELQFVEHRVSKCIFCNCSALIILYLITADIYYQTQMENYRYHVKTRYLTTESSEYYKDKDL
jgi:hypothetical protein